jgi:hypothetical protein
MYQADWECLAPGEATSPKHSEGIQRRTGTNLNRCNAPALQKKRKTSFLFIRLYLYVSANLSAL